MRDQGSELGSPIAHDTVRTRGFPGFLAVSLVLGVLILLAIQTREATHGWARRIGFLPAASTLGVEARKVAPGLPAALGGLRAGDQILAVDGETIRRESDYDRVSEGFERGHALTMEVLRQGRRLSLRIVPGIHPQWSVLVLNSLTAFAYLAVALLALAQYRKDPRIRILAAYAGALAIEIAAPAFILGRPILAPLARSLLYLLNGLELGLHYHLVLLLPDPHPWVRRHRWLIPSFYLAGLATATTFILIELSDVLFDGPILPLGASDIERLNGSYVLPLWSVGVIAFLCSQALRQTEPRGRQQAGLVLAGTLPWMLFLVGGRLWQGWIGPPADWTFSLETVVLLLPSLAFLVAIARYRLFNLEILARRSLVYTTLTSALLLIFYGTLGTASALFSRLLDERQSIWALSVATLALGLLFSPLRVRLQSAIEKRFFPEREELRQRVVRLASALSRHGNLPKMGRHLVEELTSIFSSQSVGLLISSPETGHLSLLGSTYGEPDSGVLIQQSDPAVERLRRARRPLAAGPLLKFSHAFALALPGIDAKGVLVPLHNQERLVGVLGVGPKTGRDGYSSEEIDLLSLLAHHLAVVLENARLTESATYDSLTGLLRREAVFEELERELERASRHDRPLAVAMADVDHFKGINDRYGHLAGDLILKRVARIFAQALRNTDFVGRYGGEEFLLILPETDLRGAGVAAEKVRKAVEGSELRLEDGTPVQVTLSLGICTLEEVVRRKAGSVEVEDLIAAADRSLYIAKRDGRNRIHPWIHVA